MPEEIPILIKRIKHGSNQERLTAAQSLARRSLTAEWWPTLRDLMRSKQWGLAVPRCAITAAGKLKDPPAEVIDELLAAASPGYQGEIPQYFSEAASSAIRIAPEDPRLPEVLGHALTIDNYNLQKSAVDALIFINSAASRRMLQTIRSRLPREYPEQLMQKLLTRVDAHLVAES